MQEVLVNVVDHLLDEAQGGPLHTRYHRTLNTLRYLKSTEEHRIITEGGRAVMEIHRQKELMEE